MAITLLLRPILSKRDDKTAKWVEERERIEMHGNLTDNTSKKKNNVKEE